MHTAYVSGCSVRVNHPVYLHLDLLRLTAIGTIVGGFFGQNLIMPISAPRPCVHKGCKSLVRGSSRCEVHSLQLRKQHDSQRLSSTQRGYNGRWRKVRLVHLASSPLCVRCEDGGIIRAATVVDHIIPHKGNAELFNDPNNFQSLCKTCHDKKTATEDGGGWRGRGA